MSRLTTRDGDTFEALARRAYGDNRRAGLIRSANPGTSEPFEAGVVLTAPTAPPRQSRTQEAGDSEVELLINDSRFRYWTEISVTRAIDAVDVLTLAAPFTPDDIQFREAFRPFSFAPVNVNVGGVPLFTGTMLSADPELTDSSRVVDAVCYSTPGALGDCTAPASAYPIEWNRAKLGMIAADLARPFGLTPVFEADEGALFERVALKPGQKILPFLIKLAQQRGLLVSSTPLGQPLFTTAVTKGEPRARLTEGAAPLVGVTPTFNPQGYYSEVTAVEPVAVGLRGGQVTVRNPHLAGVVRPVSFQVDDTINADIQAACEAKAGRMFASACEYVCTVATWRDPQGELWAPNTTVTVTAPGAMIYNEYEFLVRAVTLSRAGDSEVATLTLALPGALSGEVPEVLPWD